MISLYKIVFLCLFIDYYSSNSEVLFDLDMLLTNDDDDKNDIKLSIDDNKRYVLIIEAQYKDMVKDDHQQHHKYHNIVHISDQLMIIMIPKGKKGKLYFYYSLKLLEIFILKQLSSNIIFISNNMSLIFLYITAYELYLKKQNKISLNKNMIIKTLNFIITYCQNKNHQIYLPARDYKNQLNKYFL